jgi:hypothetical protein
MIFEFFWIFGFEKMLKNKFIYYSATPDTQINGEENCQSGVGIHYLWPNAKLSYPDEPAELVKCGWERKTVVKSGA